MSTFIVNLLELSGFKGCAAIRDEIPAPRRPRQEDHLDFEASGGLHSKTGVPKNKNKNINCLSGIQIQLDPNPNSLYFYLLNLATAIYYTKVKPKVNLWSAHHE